MCFKLGKQFQQIHKGASDLETTMTTQLDVESKVNGNVAIPAKLLLDILKTFKHILISENSIGKFMIDTGKNDSD